jgi:hypothetical protein
VNSVVKYLLSFPPPVTIHEPASLAYDLRNLDLFSDAHQPAFEDQRIGKIEKDGKGYSRDDIRQPMYAEIKSGKGHGERREKIEHLEPQVVVGQGNEKKGKRDGHVQAGEAVVDAVGIFEEGPDVRMHGHQQGLDFRRIIHPHFLDRQKNIERKSDDEIQRVEKNKPCHGPKIVGKSVHNGSGDDERGENDHVKEGHDIREHRVLYVLEGNGHQTFKVIEGVRVIFSEEIGDTVIHRAFETGKAEYHKDYHEKVPELTAPEKPEKSHRQDFLQSVIGKAQLKDEGDRQGHQGEFHSEYGYICHLKILLSVMITTN